MITEIKAEESKVRFYTAEGVKRPDEEDLLPDPLSDRFLPETLCPRPPNKQLSVAKVFSMDNETGELAYAPDTELIKNF